MNLNNIVYPELRAEMSKKKLTILKMANELNMDRLTLDDLLKKSKGTDK